MPNDTAVSTAVEKSSEAAQVVDKIALHLGEAAGVLGAKVSQIIDQYGPNAAALIREVGRVQAVSQVGYFVLFVTCFALFFTLFMKAWSKFDDLIKANGGKAPQSGFNEVGIADSYSVRLGIFGILSAICLIGTAMNFQLSALYGIFSPEAFLVVKLLKWG